MHNAVVAVDHQFPVLQAGVGQIDRAHDGGHTHRAGENRHVRIARTAHGNQPGQLLPGYLAERGRRQLFSYQNGVRGVGGLLIAGCVLQVSEYSRTEILDVHRTLAQVAVLHTLEMTNMTNHHLAQGPLGPLPGLDQARHLTADGGVVENTQVHVEQRVILGTHFPAQVVGYALNIRAHTGQCRLESAQLLAPVAGALARYCIEVGHR